MFDVVLDISNLSVTDLTARLREIITAASVQPAFSPMSPFLATLSGKVDTLAADEAAVTNAKSTVTARIITRDESLAAVKLDLPSLASKLGEHAVTQQDLVNANVRIKSDPTPRPVPAQPANLELSVGDEEGELGIQCDGQPGIVDFYEIRYTTTDPNLPDTVWHYLTPSKGSTLERKGLPSGQKVWVQVRATNTTGTSIWSDPACKRVP